MRFLSRGGLALLAFTILCALVPSSAGAAFGIVEWDGEWLGPDGAEIPAGAHPSSIQTKFLINTTSGPNGFPIADGSARNAFGMTPPGLVPNPEAILKCPGVRVLLEGVCPPESQVGVVTVFTTAATFGPYAVYNMPSLPGTPGTVAFDVVNNPIYLTGSVRSDGDYGLNVVSRNVSQAIPFTGVDLVFWGVPSAEEHDPMRAIDCSPAVCRFGTSSDVVNPKAFLTNPTSCTGEDIGLPMTLRLESWQEPQQSDESTFLTHEPGDLFDQVGSTECHRVPFDPDIGVQGTTDDAETPTGLEVTLGFPQQGLTNPDGLAQSHLKRTVVSLPEGMTINPSYADGVSVCTAGQIGLISSGPARFNLDEEQCPDASQIGEVEIQTPVLPEPVEGELYVAEQDDPYSPGPENPFDSLFALYIAAEGQGVGVKLAGEVSLDHATGQVVTTFDNNPQLPFSRFTLKFKGGQRAPLATPSACGKFETVAEFESWSRPDEAVFDTEPLYIAQGPNGGPCLRAQERRLDPGLTAGTVNPNAGSYSPFVLRMTRRDGEQEISSFSADLPPGLTAKLAGVSKCSDGALALAAQKRGAVEKAEPSCPASSQIGTALSGTGTGSQLTYVPGKVYLAGPYNGAPLSVATVVPAQVGPFDIGTIVVRAALQVDSDDAQVHVDPVPIPYIRQGVALHVRDIRVILDRQNFTLNPTNCDRMVIDGTLTGTGADFTSSADDPPVTKSTPFQAANCAALPFKPKLSFKLKGGTKRGQFPAFQATLKARPGDANLAKTTVVLPRSEFIEQGHIRTVCTRVQFKAQQCPLGSIYGHARAITPLFDTPVEGPVYLRSNGGERLLPDLVVSLKNGEIEVALAGFIDSVKGRVRNAFNVIPDAPVTKFTLNMQGGKKGLLVNHLDLCKVTSRADVKMVGQNGKVVETRPKMGTSCGKGRGKRQK